MTRNEFTKATGIECSELDFRNVVVPLYEACDEPELDENSPIVQILSLPSEPRNTIVDIANQYCQLQDEFREWKLDFVGAERISKILELLDVLPVELLESESVMKKIRTLLDFLPVGERYGHIICFKIRNGMPLTDEESERVCDNLGF